MTAWAYKVLVLPSSHYEYDEEVLNLQGEQGWELVSLLFDSQGNRVAYFKHPDGEVKADLERTFSDVPAP